MATLESPSLRFSSPVLFNDHEDCKWSPFWNLFEPEAHALQHKVLVRAFENPAEDPPEMPAAHRRVLEAARHELGALTEPDRNARIKEWQEELTRDGKERAEFFQAKFDAFRRSLRVLCVSEDNLSEEMWNRYADACKGAVLGFDSRRLEMHWKHPLEAVTYRESPPILWQCEEWHRNILYGMPFAFPEEGVRGFSLWKMPFWSGEKEWRMSFKVGAADGKDHDDATFPKRALVQVILGLGATEGQYGRLLELARRVNPQVQLLKVVRTTQPFGLRLDRCAP